MQTNKHSATKVANPGFIGKHQDCVVCGGRFKVVNSNQIINYSNGTVGSGTLYTRCPYCHTENQIDVDVNANFKARLNKFIHSQITPIKNIEDEKVRLPMQKLLDDFNAIVQDY